MSTMNVYSRFGGEDEESSTSCTPRASIAFRENVAKHAKSDDPIENFHAPGVAFHGLRPSEPPRSTPSCSSVRFRATSRPPQLRRVALDGFDELRLPVRELLDAGEITDCDPYNVAASHWATCHGHVGLKMTTSSGRWADIDWETTLLGSLDALRLSLC